MRIEAVSRWRSVLVGGCLLVVGISIFRDFVFGEKVLLYKDIGADSLNDTYLIFVHLSDYIRAHGLPSWSFCVGMGQSIFHWTGNLILEPVVFLPRQLIAGALVYQHLLKTLLAGLFFFRFLQLRDVDLCGSLAGALGLAFSAQMSMGSCWIVSADETLCFSFVLLGAEEAIGRGRWFYLPVAVMLSGLITVFHLYLTAIVLCVYVPLRLIEIRTRNSRQLFSVCWRLAGLALLGVGLGAVIFLSSAELIRHTPRGSGTIGNFAFLPAPGPLQFGSSLYYCTALLRPFSSDLFGTGDDYRGWENYYEAPQSYCGLVWLLLFPQIFVRAPRRQRIVASISLILIALPVAWPWLRYAFWMFQGGYFRTVSLLSIFALLTLSATVLSHYRTRSRLNLWILAATLAVSLGTLWWATLQQATLVRRDLAIEVTVFLAIYALLISVGHIVKCQRIFAWIILAVAAIEFVRFDRTTVNRPTITKREAVERIGFNDKTIEAVRDIKAVESGFFRVTKTWGSGVANRVSYNDAMVFGYYGTPCYSSFNNLDYIRFLIAVEAIFADNIPAAAQWSPGLLWHPLVSTFACEKYVITTEPVRFQMASHYEFVRRYDQIYLFRNREFVPLGLTFDHWLDEKAFLQLPAGAKPRALLQAAVLSNQSLPATFDLPEIGLDVVKEQIRDTTVVEGLAARRQNAFVLESFDETQFTGSVKIDKRSVLLFQIPFDRGWHAIVDQHAAAALKADVGLIGIMLDAGEHRVRLHYQPPFLTAGIAISVISTVIFAFLLWRSPKKQLLAHE